MEWYVAPSYKNATIEKIDEETHKAYISEKCDRCSGLGFIVSRVENGQYIPIPVDGGVCYRCGGAGVVEKWVKAYTEEEYEKYLKAQERAKERREKKAEEIRQEKIDKNEENRKALLEKWGYDAENPLIWMVGGGNTYAIKDQLKENGCKFNREFGWYNTHPFDVPTGYGLVSISFNDVYNWLPLGKTFELKENAKELAATARRSLEPESKSEWVGEIKQRLRDLKVTLSGARAVDGAYGSSILFTFVQEETENMFVWFTSCPPNEDKAIVGHKYLLTGTVKKHDEYNGTKQTQLNRCILKEFAI